MNSIKFSIVIPTSNRRFTLLCVLEGLLTERAQDFEVVVSDNSIERSDLPEEIQQDKRLRYSYSSKQMSMRENCSRAIDMASGEFLIMIGDDDFVNVEEAFFIVNELQKTDHDFALSPRNTFYWPNLTRRLFGRHSYGIEHIYEQMKNYIVLSPISELENVLRMGGCSIGRLPRLYQGIVRRECVTKIFEITGAHFNGPMPDMSSSVALVFTCRSGFISKVPFVVNGVSSSSGGGKGAAGAHSGLISEAYGLSQSDKDNWPLEIRPLWTGGTVWAASLVLTLKALKKDFYLSNLNYSYIDGYLIAFNPKLVFKYLGYQSFYFESMLVALRYLLKRAKSFFRNLIVYFKLLLGFSGRFNSIYDYHLYCKKDK